MKTTFVTLFDSNYLSRGLVLYESLLKCCEDFFLYIIAFDDKCYQTLKDLELNKVCLISLSEFEDAELLGVKENRSTGEYCWTATPKSVLYIFDRYSENVCTYIDADMMFYSDPSRLIDELDEEESILITPHRYSDYCDQTLTSGKYNVSFMTFIRNNNSADVLKWWSDKCIDDCCIDYSRGMCGDQKYLDDWTERFSGIHVMKNIGGGVAPWNVSRYSFGNNNRIIKYDENETSEMRLVFYHFHGLTFFDRGVVNLADGAYKLPDTAIAYIYKPYIREHERVIEYYNLRRDENTYQQIFNNHSIDNLRKDRNYYLIEMFM